MKHARADYERFQDPLACSREEWMAIWDRGADGEFGASPIADDEPVFLMRAHDSAFVATLGDYADRALGVGASLNFVAAVNSHAESAIQWREENGCMVPDMPEGGAK